MGWKEQREAYKTKQTLSDKKDEDLVARRVLRGLGLTEKQLPTLERELFGECKHDRPIWPRTLLVLKHSLRNAAERSIALFRRKVEVIPFTKRSGKREVLERFELYGKSDNGYPIFFARISGTTSAIAITAWLNADVGIYLTPPYKAISELPGHYHIILQDITDFVSQFGPYSYE